MRTLVFLLAVVNASCLRETQFQCTNDTSCGAGGQCEASGFCSFADPGCSSGRRYGDSAGANAGQCTSGGNPGDDGGVDSAMPTDARMIDAPQSIGCPAGYNALPGLANGHVYKVLTTTKNWNQQQADCKLTTQAAYLAVPDDAAELMALDTAAGAVTTYWVGVTDAATEGTWLNVLGQAQTFLPWLAPAPDDANPGEDCVEAIPATHNFNDQRCNTNLTAICECAP